MKATKMVRNRIIDGAKSRNGKGSVEAGRKVMTLPTPTSSFVLGIGPDIRGAGKVVFLLTEQVL
jgi:hypothetical protein